MFRITQSSLASSNQSIALQLSEVQVVIESLQDYYCHNFGATPAQRSTLQHFQSDPMLNQLQRKNISYSSVLTIEVVQMQILKSVPLALLSLGGSTNRITDFLPAKVMQTEDHKSDCMTVAIKVYTTDLQLVGQVSGNDETKNKGLEVKTRIK